MKIDLGPVFAGQVSYADAVRDVKYADLYTMTDELFASIASILAHATDASVAFVPHDSAAADQSEQGWTVGHVVAHLTATLEEAAASGAMLARGVQVEGRLRYEVPWEELSTWQKVQARLQESHRIVRAFLDAWPDEPHLEVTVVRIPRLGPMNAIGVFGLGIGHGQSHLAQLRDIVQQYELSNSPSSI